jgi:UDP-N-acetylmuramate: L-alanyl-gamma-D-glutamyl-meso-diaminopimelate ligase
LDDIVAQVKQQAVLGGHFVIMSNGSFGGLYQKLQQVLNE